MIRLCPARAATGASRVWLLSAVFGLHRIYSLPATRFYFTITHTHTHVCSRSNKQPQQRHRLACLSFLLACLVLTFYDSSPPLLCHSCFASLTNSAPSLCPLPLSTDDRATGKSSSLTPSECRESSERSECLRGECSTECCSESIDDAGAYS